MSLRFWMAPALALLAVAAAASTGAAKPPDLPQQLKITVETTPGPAGFFLQFHPLQVIPGAEFPCDQPSANPNPCVPDRKAHSCVDAEASRSVIENLDQLIAAGESLEKARKHARAGQFVKALKCVARVCELAPGSTVAQSCDEVILEVTHALAYSKTKGTCEATGCCHFGACGQCCVVAGCLGRLNQMGMCWFAFLGEQCEQLARAKMAGKCGAQQGHGGDEDCVCTKMGKRVMVDGLLKAAHLAMGAGFTRKARELVRQAHALDPLRVEADPMVFKMHLLTKTGGGEEHCEPLPEHPLQHRTTVTEWLFGGK